MTTPRLCLRAPAKVNLCLEVLGRLADGYHEVHTVLQAVDLSDTLTFERADSLTLEVVPAGAAPLQDNLVLRAAGLLRAESRPVVREGARIVLRKRIPAGAGLGGGSSDAAAALLGLRALWGVTVTDSALVRLAAALGADVPFFLRGGTALGTGRGDVMTPLPAPQERWAVLVPVAVASPAGKTARLYGMLTQRDWSGGERTAELVRRLREGQPAREELFNAFDRVAEGAFPGLAPVRAALRQAGLGPCILAGSGPSAFALAGTRQHARTAAALVRAAGQPARVVRLLAAWGPSGLAC